MHLIFCVDNTMGLMFNHRRQSQDRAVRKRILDKVSGKILWMNHYSAEQFKDEKMDNVRVDENFLKQAQPGDYCFAEDSAASAAVLGAESLILYKWNRRYPSDERLIVDLSAWTLKSSCDFAGTSHEKITEEVYIR